ncbi:MAG: CvpA family protein [Opitutaceae bacterium]|nr:CvpA family protein [Opitutaceae bacterium]
MTVIWISLAAVLLFIFIGYRRGILRILALIGALLLAGLAAIPLGASLLPLVQRAGFIPRALMPIAAPLAAGLVVFIVLSGVASWLLSRRELGREAQKLPRMEPWEKLGGAVLGGLWGCTLVVLVLTGLHLLGRVDQELAQATGETQKAEAAESVPAANTPRNAYQQLNQQIDASPLATIVQQVNPAEERVAKVFGNLAKVTSDPVLLEHLRTHPSIARLTNLPQLKAVAQDPEIQRLLRERQYYALLDDPKLAGLLEDKALVEECRKVDLEAVLAEVQQSAR